LERETCKQPQNGYKQYYFTLDGTFFEATLTRPRPGQGQILEVKAEVKANMSRPSPKFWPRGQSGLNITDAASE